MDKKPMTVDKAKLEKTRERYREFSRYCADNKYSIYEVMAFTMQMAMDMGQDVEDSRRTFKMMVDDMTNLAIEIGQNGVVAEEPDKLMAINATVQ